MNYAKEQRLKRLRHNSGFIIHNSESGFSLVEMLFYVVILSLSLIAVMQTLMVLTRSYGVLRSVQRIEREASTAMERMIREIRDANDIDDAGSVLGTNPGELLLRSTDSSGTARTVEFYLDGGKVSLRENGVVSGLLTTAKATVSNLVFRKITTTNSKGVKIEMTITTGSGPSAQSENFYATAVLRDSY